MRKYLNVFLYGVLGWRRRKEMKEATSSATYTQQMQKKKCFPVNYMAFLYLVLILPLLRIFSSGYIKWWSQKWAR